MVTPNQTDALWKKREQHEQSIKTLALLWREAIRDKDRRLASRYLKRLAEQCDAFDEVTKEWRVLIDLRREELRERDTAIAILVGEGGHPLRWEA